MAFTSYKFYPGTSDVVYLPQNGNAKTIASVLQNSLSGGVTTLSACYDKYGLIWKWSTFEKETIAKTLSTSYTSYPSSWATTQLLFSAGSTNPADSVKYPKRWSYEGALSAVLFNPEASAAPCSADNIVWTLSTNNWLVQQNIPISVTDTFAYNLRLKDYGIETFTVNAYEDTLVTVTAELSVSCLDTSVSPASTTTTLVTETHSFTAVAPPSLSLYTSNRFVLTGTPVKFENLITNIKLVTALSIDFDDGKTAYLTGNDITQSYFITSYDILGYKTIKLTAYTVYTNQPLVQTFPDIIQVLKEYDVVSPTEYRSTSNPVVLPWPSQPLLSPNELAVNDNINNCFKQFYENLQYLESKSILYTDTYSDYFGYLGVPPTVTSYLSSNTIWTWEDADCLNTDLNYAVTWRSVLSSQSLLDTGEFVSYGTWADQECDADKLAPDCTQKGSVSGTTCIQWNWKSRKSANTLEPITWKDAVSAGAYPKQWRFEACPASLTVVCDEGSWQVNIPKLDTYYDPIANLNVQSRCTYNGVAVRDNLIYAAQKTQIKLLSSDRSATFYSVRDSFDGVTSFANIKNICLDSAGKIYILDSLLSQVGVYTYEPDTPGDDWVLFTSWGGVGTAGNENKFSAPNDIHIDQLDNVWICDTGNACVKQYANTGSWINTIKDETFIYYPPLSLTVDSQYKVHVLTSNSIRVYNYKGVFEFEYSYLNFITSTNPQRINTSYNREMVYVAFKTEVIRFFRNGVFSGRIVNNKTGVNNITDIVQDEFRNLYVSVNDKILKYGDIMKQIPTKGTTPIVYWTLNDILIHKEEYIQNWVYTKAFQRLWDNIEIFRNTLHFTNGKCKGYAPPIHGKDKMIIGQNEIVTSTVINRVLGYLWDNFYTMIKYFEPSCVD